MQRVEAGSKVRYRHGFLRSVGLFSTLRGYRGRVLFLEALSSETMLAAVDFGRGQPTLKVNVANLRVVRS